jgi:hypothetical protein
MPKLGAGRPSEGGREELATSIGKYCKDGFRRAQPLGADLTEFHSKR